jgi:uroporphyrinogen-III synthase
VKIKKILISQPAPATDKSPYSDLAEKYSVKFEFYQFIHVQRISVKEFRKQRIDILDHTAIIFTSKTGIDNFFRVADEFKVVIPETMKYFCISESIALYLQKYIVYRKRKIFFGATGQFRGMLDVMAAKHHDDKYLVVLSDMYKAEIPLLLDKGRFKYTKGVFYKTVSSNLSHLDIKSYDILAFFSPQGIKSLFVNFPDFKQGTTIIAAFGPTTAKAVQEAGLTLNIPVPTPEALSMPSALELFIKQQAKGGSVAVAPTTNVAPQVNDEKLPPVAAKNAVKTRTDKSAKVKISVAKAKVKK